MCQEHLPSVCAGHLDLQHPHERKSSHLLTETRNTLLTKLGELSLSVQMPSGHGKVKFEVTFSMHIVIEWIRCVLEKHKL